MLTTNPVDELKRRFNAQAAKNLTASFLFKIDGLEGGPWMTVITAGTLDVIAYQQGASPKPDCTISVSLEDLQAIMSGKLSAMTAAMSGMLSIDGDLGLAMQLVPVFFS